MATTTIPWGDGSGDNIYLTYSSASGNQTVEVTSDENTSQVDRTKNILFSVGSGSTVITKTLSITQEAAEILVGLPYIRGGSDGSYIDTGITADNTVKVIIWARNWNPTSGFLFGSRVGLKDTAFDIGTDTNQYAGSVRIDFASEQSYVNDQFANLSHYHKYELYAGTLKVDDAIIGNVSSSTFSNNHNIHLFGINNGGSHVNNSLPIDVFACDIYKNGNLVRSYSAVKSPSIGLYDSVSQTLFANSGSGSFSYGRFDPTCYTSIEYIQSNGLQRFDTGIHGTKALPVVLKFRLYTNSYRSTLFGVNYSSGGYFAAVTGNSNTPNRYLNVYLGSSTQQAPYSSTNPRLTNKTVVFIKSGNTVDLYENNAHLGTQKTFSMSDSYRTNDTIEFAAYKSSSTGFSLPAYAYFYYAGFGAERNFVPAIVNSVAGMYDTYNDVFYASETGTDFIAPQ